MATKKTFINAFLLTMRIQYSLMHSEFNELATSDSDKCCNDCPADQHHIFEILSHATGEVVWSVCLCGLNTPVGPAKMAEPLDMPF